jgi:hypothetical protein
MIIQNKTKCPTNLLSRLIDLACEAIGARPAVIKITQARSAAIRGFAIHPDKIRITIPEARYDHLATAENWFRVLLHEVGHILDYGDATKHFLVYLEYTNKFSTRRIKHDLRPSEISANKYAKDAQEKLCNTPLYSDLIIELAGYLQGANGGKTSQGFKIFNGLT